MQRLAAVKSEFEETELNVKKNTATSVLNFAKELIGPKKKLFHPT